MTDYFAHIAARVEPRPDRPMVRPAPIVFAEVDDPFEATAPFESVADPLDADRPAAATATRPPETPQPTPPGHGHSERRSSDAWPTDIRPVDTPAARAFEPASPAEVRRVAVGDDDTTSPRGPGREPLVPPRPLAPAVGDDRSVRGTAVVDPVRPAGEVSVVESLAASPARVEPRDVPSPAPVSPIERDTPADALALADAFMRGVLEPTVPHEPLPAEAPVDEQRPQVVIDRVTVEIVRPDPAPSAPVAPRMPRAAGRLASGRRVDSRWGS